MHALSLSLLQLSTPSPNFTEKTVKDRIAAEKNSNNYAPPPLGGEAAVFQLSTVKII